MTSPKVPYALTVFAEEDWNWRHYFAALCVGLFILAIGLGGTSRFAGILYALSITFALPFLNKLYVRRLSASYLLDAYILVYMSFLCIFSINIIVFESKWNNIDNISRIGFGLINGGFFLAFLRHDRKVLFSFLVLLAFVHSVI